MVLMASNCAARRCSRAYNSRILERDCGIGGEQGQQVHGFIVEGSQLVALAIEHADNLVCDDQWHGYFRARIGVARNVSGIFSHVWGIDRALCLGSRSGNPFADRNTLQFADGRPRD